MKISNEKKHAYLIIAHNNVETLKKIVELLDYELNDIYIHIDKKSDILTFKCLESIPKKSKIKIYSKIKTYWGHFSQVEVEYFLMKEASKGDYCYYHLISGVDLPLKKQEYIHKFFEENKGKEFVHFTSKKIDNDKIEWINYYHFFQKFLKISRYNIINIFFKCIEKMSLKIQKIIHIHRYNENYQIQKGANWFSVDDECIKYVISKENWVKKHFKYSKSPDELFLQTLIINSQYKERLYIDKYNDDYHACMRYIDWNRGGPYTFRKSDFKELMYSDFLWGRKFDERVDIEIINMIFKHLNDKIN